MTYFLDAFESFFRPPDDRFSLIFKEDDLDASAVLIYKRMYVLSWLPLLCSVYFVSIMIVESNAEFVGSAGLALLECIILRQTSFQAKGRTLGHVSHMRNVSQMFFALTASKAFALVYSTYDICRMPEEALGELECSYLRWATTAVLAVFGYVTYVAALCMGRLAEQFLLKLAKHESLEP